jgi:hypothetical protein
MVKGQDDMVRLSTRIVVKGKGVKMKKMNWLRLVGCVNCMKRQGLGVGGLVAHNCR